MHNIDSQQRSERVEALLNAMTIEEKIGQLCQVSGNDGKVSDDLQQRIISGMVGSVINEVCPDTLTQLQQLAVEQSRLGIPLLFGRDVIHGFKTIFPIPLGQAASFNPSLVKQAARIAAEEALAVGINWTFAPMIDISRDPRWGRIAESFGEDPYLCSVLGVAMVDGYQADNFSRPGAIAACAKHFVGYGASESGRDYATTNIPANELRNIYLPPFKAACDVGVATLMTSFSDLDGIPASANEWLLTDVLKKQWQYSGFVVSDWESISQLQIHGLTANAQESAHQAFNAGVDMEMVSQTYQQHLQTLLEDQRIDIAQLDDSVARILTLKEKLGLFDQPRTPPETLPPHYHLASLQVAQELASQSCVLLQNHRQTLPLDSEKLTSIALIGPLADDGYEQLGTWIFDGEEQHSVTLLDSLTSQYGDRLQINHCRGMTTSRSYDRKFFDDAKAAANSSDVVVMCLGEESILSGEAHCRAKLDLPGNQQELIETVAQSGKPIVLIVMAGRPLILEPVIKLVDSILYAWHPGTMAGPALTDLLFGQTVPSGKLPVSFPRTVGQIPIYYNQKHSGKPATEAQFVFIDDIEPRSPQTSLGMASNHLDSHFSAQFVFGFGLSYSQFDYFNLQLSHLKMSKTQSITVTGSVRNIGQYDAREVVQLYIRDHVGSITRPVKELKKFTELSIKSGQQKSFSFVLTEQDIRFYGKDGQCKAEPGQFTLWVGGDANCTQSHSFEFVD